MRSGAVLLAVCAALAAMSAFTFFGYSAPFAGDARDFFVSKTDVKSEETKQPMAEVLCLPAAPRESVEVVESHFVAPLEWSDFEHCGRAFEAWGVRKYGPVVDESKAANDAKRSKTPGSARNGSEDTEFDIRIDQVPDAELDEYYKLLGLGHREAYASQKEIKAAYRKVALLFHPDKNPSGDRVDNEARYKAIGEAYEILNDPLKRRLYESKMDFDDSLPKPGVEYQGSNSSKFYKRYAPVFKRNAKFSTNQPVPELGDEKSSDDHVNSFYDFWFGFKSWRDFSFLGEHKIENAQGRDEKRWMMKENKAAAAQATKDEVKRIRRLVDQAFRVDPRVKLIKERQIKEKEERKQAKKEKQRKEREERAAEARKKEEEAKRKENESVAQRENAKKAREKEKQALKKARSKFRKMCAEKLEGKQNTQSVATFCTTLSAEQLVELTAELSESSSFDEASTTFADALSKLEQSEKEKEKEIAARKREEIAKRREKERAEKEEAENAKDEWTHNELSMLSKAFGKFPAGTPRRWNQISIYLGTNRSVKDIIAKSREMKREGSKGVKGDSYEVYKTDLEKKKYAKSSKLTAPPPDRVISSDKSSKGDESTQATETPTKIYGKPDENWSVEQQAALEKGLKLLKTFPPKEKWNMLAERVPGKTKAECIARFKEIRAKIMAKKQAKKAAKTA